MNEPERVIIRPGGVGDTLLLAPALSALRESGTSTVTLVGYPPRLEPLAKAGLADRILPLDVFLVLSSTDPTPARVDSFFSSLPAYLMTHPGLHVHDPFPPEDGHLHVAEYLAGCLGARLGPERSSPLESLLGRCPPNRKPILWIHPGSGGKRKRWPLQHFLVTATGLSRMTSVKAVFLLGEAEEDLEAGLHGAGFEVRRPSSVMELCALFAPGDRFLGNDSGPTHLAALMGLSTLALFGPTDPEVWGPWGERARWMAGGDGENWIDPGIVLEKARHWWSDSPI